MHHWDALIMEFPLINLFSHQTYCQVPQIHRDPSTFAENAENAPSTLSTHGTLVLGCKNRE